MTAVTRRYNLKQQKEIISICPKTCFHIGQKMAKKIVITIVKVMRKKIKVRAWSISFCFHTKFTGFRILGPKPERFLYVGNEKKDGHLASQSHNLLAGTDVFQNNYNTNVFRERKKQMNGIFIV